MLFYVTPALSQLQKSEMSPKVLKKVHTLFLILEECSFSYFLLTCFWRVVFIRLRLKFNEEKTQRGEKKRKKQNEPCLAGQKVYHAIWVSLFMVKLYTLSPPPLINGLSFPCVAGNYPLPVVELLCFTGYEVNNSSKAEHRSEAQTGTTCQGPCWWHHHHCCHFHCGQTPVGKGVSWTAAHTPCRPLYPTTEVSPH